VTPLNGFSGTVDFTCSGLPTHTACHFNPPSVISSGTSILTISTNEASAELTPPKNRRHAPFYAIFLSIGGLAWLSAGLPCTRSRRKGLMGVLLCCCLVFFGLSLMVACGSGGSVGANRGGGIEGGAGATTPPGTYSIAVTGTSGSSSHKAILILKVN
jgi:hypothetical protein